MLIVEDGTPADPIADGGGWCSDLHQAWIDSLASVLGGLHDSPGATRPVS